MLKLSVIDFFPRESVGRAGQKLRSKLHLKEVHIKDILTASEALDLCRVSVLEIDLEELETRLIQEINRRKTHIQRVKERRKP